VAKTDCVIGSQGAGRWHAGSMGTVRFSAPVHTQGLDTMDPPEAIGAGFPCSVFDVAGTPAGKHAITRHRPML
jgi:hypothetical protein